MHEERVVSDLRRRLTAATIAVMTYTSTLQCTSSLHSRGVLFSHATLPTALSIIIIYGSPPSYDHDPDHRSGANSVRLFSQLLHIDLQRCRSVCAWQYSRISVAWVVAALVCIQCATAMPLTVWRMGPLDANWCVLLLLMTQWKCVDYNVTILLVQYLNKFHEVDSFPTVDACIPR